jgi:histidyl-tRNA synthetase
VNNRSYGIGEPAALSNISARNGFRALDKFYKFGVEGVTLLLGKGRKDESGDITQGAGLGANQIDVLLEFITSRSVTRAETVRKLANRDDVRARGVAELGEIGAILLARVAGRGGVLRSVHRTRGLGPCVRGRFLVFRDPEGNALVRSMRRRPA